MVTKVLIGGVFILAYIWMANNVFIVNIEYLHETLYLFNDGIHFLVWIGRIYYKTYKNI